jgi:hypothetical protein
MARLVQPRPDPNQSEDLVTEVFQRHGFVNEAHTLAAICRATGLGDGTGDELREDHERLVEHVAAELRKLVPAEAVREVVLLLAIYALEQTARQSARGWKPDESTLVTAAIGRCEWTREALPGALRVAFAVVKGGPVHLKRIVGALFGAGHLDPLEFIDLAAVRSTTKGTGGASWNQQARENDPSLPDYWFALDPVRTFDAFRRLFEVEPIDTLGVLALGIERAISLQYPGTPVSLAGSSSEIEMRELYSHVGPLALVLCRRRADAQADARTLTRCCWSYSRVLGENAPEVLGDAYQPLVRLAFAELENLRKVLRGPDAEAFLDSEGAHLSEAVFFVPRTDATALWPILRRLVLALREVPRRGVPLDLRTWDERGDAFEKVPRPWNWVVDHIARVLELLLGRELQRDPELKELRREFAKFCIDRTKTREKARPDQALTNESFFEPKPEWRAAYVNAAKELHPNLGERGHHALNWSRDHDPDEDVRDAARSAAEVIRHGHGLPKNMSPRRAMFAAFWWLRQAHVVSLGGQVDAEGAQRTFRKEMRRQADIEK